MTIEPSNEQNERTDDLSASEPPKPGSPAAHRFDDLADALSIIQPGDLDGVGTGGEGRS